MRQFSKARRRLAVGAFLIVAGPVALGSVAYACQSLATLHVNPGTAAAGSQVTLFGKRYGSAATMSNIQIRLDTRDGRIIHEFTPRATIENETITIPADVAVGTHTLLATQFNLTTGVPQSGSPGRASLNVTAPAGRVASEGSAASAAATSSSPVAATPVAATPAAPAAVTAPAASSAAASVATAPAAAQVAATAPADAAATAAAAPAAAAAVDNAAASVVATPAAASAPDAAQVTVGGLLPASSSSSSVLPGLTLGAGLALVLLSLGAFLKSSRNVRSDTPLAG